MIKINFIEEFKKITQDAWKKGWHERNGGNLTYRLTDNEVKEAKTLFNEDSSWVDLNIDISNLKNECFLVTGSGKFLKNIKDNIANNAGIIKISEDGKKYKVLWGLENNATPTSELPSHLMSHSIKFDKTNGVHRVIMHSHPTNLIALTFVLPLEGKIFTRQLWEMATECPVVFPDGIGVLPWMVPGEVAIGLKTQKLMAKHDAVIWAHHGMFCSGETLDLTFALMDTIEKSAEILVKVLSMGGKKQTIQKEEFEELATAFNVTLEKEAINQ